MDPLAPVSWISHVLPRLKHRLCGHRQEHPLCMNLLRIFWSAVDLVIARPKEEWGAWVDWPHREYWRDLAGGCMESYGRMHEKIFFFSRMFLEIRRDEALERRVGGWTGPGGARIVCCLRRGTHE